MRTLIADIASHEGQEVELSGWVDSRRDHGKIIFIDIRDRSGLAQVVLTPQIADADTLRAEYVIKLTGLVKKRPASMVNDKIASGGYEIEAKALEILNKAEALPISVNTDGYEISEEVRLKYRYLDLRRTRMQRNMRLRHKVTNLVRQYLNTQDFIEIETPMLTKTAPEGARDFLVPSRLQPGKFYALPQSPQQYKQMLMVAGLERYYQIAKAMRDEDLRGDRQLEHTQVDLEMSFATGQDVRDLMEGMMIHVAEACGKKIWKKPFPVFTHEEALAKFGADKFDLRSTEEKENPDILAFAWVIDFPLLEWNEEEKRYTFAHNPFSAPKKNDVQKLMNSQDLPTLHAEQYDLVCNGYEMASGGERIQIPEIQRKVFEIMGLTPEQTEERFGHLIHAYEFGAPPHAGIAEGLDRLVMLLANEPNIREMIAFPVTSSGQTSVMDAPSEASKKQLDELGIKIVHKEK